MEMLINKSVEIVKGEEEMFPGIQSDDQEYFGKMYNRFSPALSGLILKWTQDRQTAEILLRNVFIKAWRSRKLYDATKERLFIWLCKIARNDYIDHMYNPFRKKGR